jgi:hypothetical protein
MRFFLALLLAIPSQILAPIVGSVKHVGGGSAVAFVQMKSARTSGIGGCVMAMTGNLVAGHGVLVMMTWTNSSGTNSIATVTDTQGLTYTISAASKSVSTLGSFSEMGSQGAYTFTGVTSAADTITVTPTAGTALTACTAIEVTAGQFNTTISGNQTGNSSFPSAGSLTSAANGAFFFDACIVSDGFGLGNTMTPDSGWTQAQQGGGGNEDDGMGYQAQTTAGALVGSFTNRPGSPFGGQWAATMMVFKP